MDFFWQNFSLFCFVKQIAVPLCVVKSRKQWPQEMQSGILNPGKYWKTVLIRIFYQQCWKPAKGHYPARFYSPDKLWPSSTCRVWWTMPILCALNLCPEFMIGKSMFAHTQPSVWFTLKKKTCWRPMMAMFNAWSTHWWTVFPWSIQLSVAKSRYLVASTASCLKNK